MINKKLKSIKYLKKNLFRNKKFKRTLRVVLKFFDASKNFIDLIMKKYVINIFVVVINIYMI